MFTKYRIFLAILLFITVFSITGSMSAQQKTTPVQQKGMQEDSLIVKENLTIRNDTVKRDTVKVKKNKQPIADVITYQSADSMVVLGNNTAFMYGKADVKYQDIQLDADLIRMNMDSSMVYAIGRKDTAGVMLGNPVFKDKSGEYKSKTINYNFKNQKGYITDIVTQQGEGYLTGGRTKKEAGDVFYMTDGKYTTCDQHDCPHFYLQLTEAKVIPKKNIVTGPSYLVLADVPLPLAIPFGFFPFNDKYSSGVIMPTYGDELTRGFYLRDGGYYFAINDYIDLALTGEIYTKGSWGLNAASNYIKRYKFSGNFNVGYLVSVYGDKGLPDYSKQTNFKMNWTHTQDSKANPNLNFSASVNFSTSGYDRNDLNAIYNPHASTESTTSSSVNMTYNFPNSPFTLSTTANVTQRQQDSSLNVSFPDLTLNMNRIYPFKRKEAIGDARWYEKISMNYTGLFRNSIQTKQDKFLKSSLIKDWRNGMQHSIPVSATFDLMKYINITPSFNFTDRMYTNKIMRDWDSQQMKIVNDTTYGFYNVYNFNFSVSAQTKLYGFYTPLKLFQDMTKIQTVRHVFTPSISYSAAPDFSDPRWGFYNTFAYVDKDGNRFSQTYSPFEHQLFGTAPRGKQGVISFNMAHNLEMKLLSKSDSTGFKKISLIDNLTAGISYNAAVDSFQWSDISTSIRLKLTQSFSLQTNATFDTYTYNEQGRRINVPRWKAGKGLGRLRSTGASFSYSFNNDTFKKWFGPKDTKDDKSKTNAVKGDDQNTEPPNPNEPKGNTEEKDKKKNELYNSDGYMKWTVPWNLSLSYSMNYGYGKFNSAMREYERRITQNLSINGNVNLTKGWAFTFTTSYDFELKKMAYMNCTISRDLHCWGMSASFIPVGPLKSYNFSIAVKSSLLSDLKYDKRSNPRDKMDWY